MSIKPRLTRFDLTMIVVSLVIGMGIFRTPGNVAQRAGNEVLFYAAWLCGGIVSLCGALTFAEIGARYPNAGGFYKTLSHCYHPSVAFMAEWVLAISNIASVAAVAIIGAGYINPVLLPASLQNDLGIKITTISSVLLLYVVNYLGIKMSARVQNFLTLFKISMIIILCFAVFNHDVPTASIYTEYTGSAMQAFGLALIPVFFTYTGYALTINMGGDIANPSLNIPKAIFAGIGIVLVLYLLLNYVYCSVLGFGGLQQTDIPAAKLAEVLFGPTGYKITSVLMFLSVLAYVNVYIMSNPRVYYAMAEDGILPTLFKKVNPKTQVQEWGISLFVLAVLVTLFFADSFGNLLNYTMFFNTTGLILGASAIFILRKRNEQRENKIYNIKWYPLIPVVFIAAYIYVTVCIVADDPAACYIYAGAFVMGALIYFLCTKNSRQK